MLRALESRRIAQPCFRRGVLQWTVSGLKPYYIGIFPPCSQERKGSFSRWLLLKILAMVMVLLGRAFFELFLKNLIKGWFCWYVFPKGYWEQQQLKFAKLVHVAGIYEWQILEGVLRKLKAHENSHSSSLNSCFMHEQHMMTSIMTANMVNIYIRIWLGFFKWF